MMTQSLVNLEDLAEFDNHPIVSVLIDKQSGLKGFIAIHRGGLVMPTFGATRIWSYTNEIEALKDTLKLSRIMSYKSALAGLKYGGAKAVILTPTTDKVLVLKTYSKFLNYLGGHFITGADVGVSEEDLHVMSKESKYIVGLKADPVKFTMLGVFKGLQVCIREVFSTSELEKRSIALQGLGKTGMSLLQLIYGKIGKIYVTDINPNAIKRAQELYPKIIVVNDSEIHTQDVDIFAPCALSNTINSKTLPLLKCKIIVGSANSQLENDHIGEEVHKKGILYAPDYVVNAGGLMTVVDEYENKNVDETRVSVQVNTIEKTLARIIEKSKQSNRSTNSVANEMAEKIFSTFT